MTLNTGEILQHRYRIVSPLGRGGMGAVYRAWHLNLNLPVAIKEMTPQPGLDAQVLAQLRQQFQQEAAILARLDHTHLVGVMDFFEEKGNVYLVMHFVEGESLVDRVEWEGVLPEGQVQTWANAYCKWVRMRLPTEAEWEYAARGEQGVIYPGGDTFDGTRLNFCDVNCPYDWRVAEHNDGYEREASVGSLPTGASWCRALDMAGNVWEWVADWYDGYPSGAQTNPTGPTDGSSKALRGGGWYRGQRDARAANRSNSAPDGRGYGVGFRCAASTRE